MRLSLASATVVALLLPTLALAQTSAPQWGPAPGVFPPGARMAVLQGDPSQTTPFTVRLEFPDGYRIAPHYHPTDEHVTVISGTFLIGMGDSIDATHATVLAPGGFVTAPANMHHYAIARGKTVVQVHAIGPFALTYVQSKDDPRKTASAR